MLAQRHSVLEILHCTIQSCLLPEEHSNSSFYIR